MRRQRRHWPIWLASGIIASALFANQMAPAVAATDTGPNLYALEAGTGMRFRAELATQIRDLPDGAQITYRAGESPE